MEHVIPAGRLGPEPVKLDVRAYLVPHESGLVLVDTGMDRPEALSTWPWRSVELPGPTCPMS